MRKRLAALCYIFAFMALASCSQNYPGHYKVGKSYVINKKTYVPKEVTQYNKIGKASWYGKKFHGRKTANGEVFNRRGLTAAHHTLPLPSVVKVTNLSNNRSVVVVVNDRGPFKKNRVIDLSEKAAEVIDMKRAGVANVKIELLPHATGALHRKLAINSVFVQPTNG